MMSDIEHLLCAYLSFLHLFKRNVYQILWPLFNVLDGGFGVCFFLSHES